MKTLDDYNNFEKERKHKRKSMNKVNTGFLVSIKLSNSLRQLYKIRNFPLRHTVLSSRQTDPIYGMKSTLFF